ncbi:MAG: helix-turn-helix domain-containing protein [Oxalobacter sp.]
MSREHIQDVVRRSLLAYFEDLDGQIPTDIYSMIIKTVEKPMLMVVMEQAGFVQSHAAEMLGINRNTLRKKLAEHNLLDLEPL